jgi:hypothetical protein
MLVIEMNVVEFVMRCYSRWCCDTHLGRLVV